MSVKKLLTVAAAAVLASCGGGGGGSSYDYYDLHGDENSTSATVPATSTQDALEGYFYASVVRGITVCARNTGECVQTDENGHFAFSSTTVSSAGELEFKVGSVSIGNAEVAFQAQAFNPVVVAEGDQEVGSAIGALLHALAGDETGSAPAIDLSGVEAEADAAESLEDALKEGKTVMVRTGDGRLFKVFKGGAVECADEACTDGKEVSWDGLKEWTIVYYAAADNDLFPYVELDLEEMEKTGVPATVNLVAFYDNPDGTFTVLHYDAAGGRFQKIEGSVELNSADPTTFETMVGSILSAYPAKRYFLIISSHGDGVRSVPVQSPTRFVAYDSNPPDSVLYNYQFQQALEVLKRAGYPVFDLIGFDECLAGSSELLYAVKDYAKYGVIASEYTEPGSGWNYGFLSVFNSSTPPDPSEVARAVVDAYGSYYSSFYEGNESVIEDLRNITLAYYPTDFIKTYEEGIAEFSNAALKDLYLEELLGQLRGELIPVEDADDCSRVDAYDLWQKVYDRLVANWDECVQKTYLPGEGEQICTQAKDALEKILSVKNEVYAYHLKDYSYGVGEGLPSIFFPFTGIDDDYAFYFLSPQDGYGYYNPFTATFWPQLVEYLFVLQNNEGTVEITTPACTQ